MRSLEAIIYAINKHYLAFVVGILDNIKATIYLKPYEISLSFTYCTKNAALKAQKVNQVNICKYNRRKLQDSNNLSGRS